MSINSNFHNKSGRIIYNHVYEGDEILCYLKEKAQAFLGYFAMVLYAKMVKMDPDENGFLH